jgi:putative holliday junction resolvase
MAAVLGLDVGTKTVGIAVSDPGRRLAVPVSTLARRSVRDDCERLDVLARSRAVERVVVGLPYELDGSEGRSARLARQIGAGLAALGWAVSYVDERFTSVDAERQLIEVGMSRARRREVIDQAAAVLILQSFLDHPELEEHG